MKIASFIVLIFSFFIAFANPKLCNAETIQLKIDESKHLFAENTQSIYQTCSQLIQSGKLIQAEESLKKALEQNQDDPQLLHLIGKTYLYMKKFDQAQAFLEKAFRINPETHELAYDLGLVYFKQSKFKEASDIFLPYLKSNPNHVLASYYEGMSLYKLKKYSEAFPYLVFASDKNPDIRANGYYHAAISMFLAGYLSKAFETFKYVQRLPDSGILRDYAAKWITEIENDKKGLKPYNIFFRIGALYDDNVRLETNEEDYPDEDDTACETLFDVSYKLGDSDLKIGIGMNHYQKWHTDLSKYDLSGSSMTFFIKSRYDMLTYGISYRPMYYTTSDERYSIHHRIAPEISWQMSDRLFTIFSFGYTTNNNYQKDVYDGNSTELAINSFYSLSDNLGLIMAGFGSEINSAQDVYESYEQINTNIGYQRKIPFGMDASGTFKLSRKQFARIKALERTGRIDNKYALSLDLSKGINTWLKGSFEFKFIKRDSNVESYDYSKRVVGLYLNLDY